MSSRALPRTLCEFGLSRFLVRDKPGKRHPQRVWGLLFSYFFIEY